MWNLVWFSWSSSDTFLADSSLGFFLEKIPVVLGVRANSVAVAIVGEVLVLEEALLFNEDEVLDEDE